MNTRWQSRFVILMVGLALTGGLLLSGCRMQTMNSTAMDSMMYGSGSPDGNSDAAFAQVRSLINTKCASCHTHAEWAGYSESDWINYGYVIPGDPANSKLYSKLKANGGTMPQIGSLTSDEV